jgi:hypothetical protein
MSVFTALISSAEISGHSPHPMHAFSLRFLSVFCYYFCCMRCCTCIFCIKFTACLLTPVVSFETESMASDDAFKVPRSRRRLRQINRDISMEATSSWGDESDRESRCGGSESSETASNNFGRLKVMVAAALARISCDFGPSSITKACIGSMETYALYFPKGYGGAPARSLYTIFITHNTLLYNFQRMQLSINSYLHCLCMLNS